MKKLLVMMMLLLNVIGAGKLWAETTTIDLTTGSAVCSKISDGSFTFTPAQGTGSNPTYFTDGHPGLRFYAGNALTISSSSLTITDVSIQYTNDGEGNIRSNSINNMRIDTDDSSSWGKKFTSKSFADNNKGVSALSLSPARNSIVFSFNTTDNSKSPSLFIASITVTYADKTTIPDADFKFAHSYRNTHYGETYAGNPFTNTYGVPVTYSSSNTAAATVDPSTGAVTIQNVGSIQSTTITATFAGNSEYNAKTATYALNVTPALTNYTDIPVSALRYQPGVNGINATGMARQVGGFNLTFDGGDGIKCNNTNNFYFRTNGSGAQGIMQIAMDGNNDNDDNGHTTKYIKKIVFTAWNDPSLAVSSVAKSSGTLTQTGPREWTWTNFYDNVTNVFFTSQGDNGEYFLISNIRVYTDAAPEFSKATPTPAFNRNSDSFNTGASVNISDLDINTTPVNFLFDYTFNAGNTGLTHTPYSTNTTWPGTITGTVAEGTATISASFDGSSNPFYNSVDPTNVYTLTVTTPAKNTFVWDFTTLSSVDTKLLNVATKDTWVLNGDGNWQPTGGATIAGPISQNSKELEYVYGLELYNSSTNDNNTLIYGNGGGFRLNRGYLRIPNLKAGDKVTVLCYNYSANRGITIPANIKNDETATGWGEYGSKGEYTCVGYVKEDGNVDLASTSAMDVRRITVESANKAWPTLSFANGSTVNVETPYNGDPLNYTNALTSVPAGATVTYSILLDKNTGDDAATINNNTGALTIKKTGEIIVRATVTAGTYNSAYYCDYILNATQASEFASWEYSADSKEIDGEDRPYQGTVTFTGSGKIAGGTQISDVPGITLTIGASGEDWNVVSDATVGLAAYNANSAATRPTNFTTGCYYTFVPTVNGYLNMNVNASGWAYIYENGIQIAGLQNKTGEWGEVKLIAGNTYVFCKKSDGAYLHSFTFRPAFLTPDETAEQTATFVANSSTTAFPKLVHSADAGVRFSGNRSVVNLSNDGGVTLVGGGTAVVRGKVIAGENELTASYTLEANVLSVAGMTPANGSTITTLDNHSVYIQFSDEIDSTVDDTKVVVLKDATPLTNINVAKAGSSVSLHEKTLVLSGFPSMEAGSTYTIRLKSGCVSKKTDSDDSDVKNPEFIGTFTIESTEPPLTWVYPNTTSAVRIGTSIVLQTSAKIDESYPSGGVIGTLTYEGGENAEGYPMTMTAIKDDKKLVFKPTKPMVPNKLYTLTIAANKVKLDGSNSMITKDKVFMFTTGTATGDAPVLTLEKSTPANGAVIDLPASTDKINLYFDQNLELEPYSTVSIIPVNGSESLSRGTSEKLNDAGVLVPQNMTIDSEDPTHLSFEVGSDLKYDLYYEMVIPANIVTAPGGMPNSAYTVKFKVNRNPNSHEVVASTFYPHTWDFNKFGNQTVSTTTAYNIINNCGDPEIAAKRVNSLYYDSTKNNYTTNAKNGYGFDQGNDVYFNNKNGVKETLDEFEGIRISLVKSTSNRFELANTGSTNADGTTKWQFRMNGNTHYMTLSNVPKGKLYMVINTKYIGINSPNATFEEVEGATISNEGTLMNTNGTRKVVIDVTEAGDVSFCVKDFTCEKIAVAADTKTFKKNYVKDDKTYATDCLGYDVRYDLLNAFTDNSVKAYYITAMANSTGNTATVTATEVNQVNAVKGSQGVLVVYKGAVENDTEVPVFKTDVNTSAKEVVASDATSEQLVNLFKTRDKIATKPADHYLYVLSYTGSQGGGLGFYNYVGSAYIDRAAYLFMPKEWVGEDPYGSGTTSARKVSLITIDAEGVTTGVSEVETEKTPNNDGYFYNLNGIRVEHPKAGIYIRNGKKVVMK